MSTRIATGLVASDGGVDAFAEAAGRAALGLGGAPADLAAVFAATPNLDHIEEGLAAVEARLAPGSLIGCGAQGVVGPGRELENGGVVVWAGHFPDAGLESFHLEAVNVEESQVAVAGMPTLADADAVLLLVDPYTFPVEPLLAQMSAEHPGLPVIGGITSAGGGVLLHDEEIARGGAVGVALRGVDVRPCVSQGARPIGPEMVITRASANVIHELASKPALVRLTEAIAELDEHERNLAARGLLVGIVIDENQPDYERGDFLVRGLLSADESVGTVTVGERVRVGQTIRLHVRDSLSADEDLRDRLAHEIDPLPASPAGALVFTCTGRGSQMFDVPDHDALAVEAACAGAPAAGFFCAGEIGPVGNRNFLHGFTATVAVFSS